MITLIYVLATLGQSVCLFFAWRNFQKTRSFYELFPLLVIVGLVYDNIILAIGAFIGEGDTLKTLNAVRFIIHGLLTPTLMIWGYGVARRLGLGWAQSARNHAICCTLATAMILLGLYSDLLSLSLELRVEDGITRYINVGGIKGPPIPSVVTIIFLIGVGIAVWRKNKSWGLAVGGILMFISAMVGVRINSIANIGEVLMSAGVVSGENTAIQQGKPMGRTVGKALNA